MTPSLFSRSHLCALCLTGLALLVPAAAGAQGFAFNPGFGFICGAANLPPFPLFANTGDPAKFASLNVTTTILADTDADQKTKVQHTVSLRIFNLAGVLQWKVGPISLTSNEFALPINFPGFEGVTPAVLPDTSSHLAVFPGFGTECVGAGIAVHNNKRYVLLGIGTTASDGTALAPVGLSKVNILVFTEEAGNLVFTHKIRPKNGWFLGAFGGFAVYDVNGDGNAELVVPRERGLPNNKAEFLYEYFNLVNGNKKGKTKIVQTNNELNENPEIPIAD